MNSDAVVVIPDPVPLHALGLLGRWMLEGAGRARPARLVSVLGETGICLGRHQRDAAVRAPARRRAAGGPALSVAAGTVAGYVRLPDPGWDPERVVNHGVRPILRALANLGARPGVHYFGRDAIHVGSARVASVSLAGDPARGACVLELLVAVPAPLALPAGLAATPEHDDPRVREVRHTCLGEVIPGISSERVAAAVAGGERVPVPDDLATLLDGEGAPPAPDARGAGPAGWTGWRWSGWADVPIGFVEALVRLAGDGEGDDTPAPRPGAPRVLSDVRLHGDFAAPDEAMRGLTRSLAGLPARLDVLVPVVRAALSRPSGWIFGVRDPAILAEAVVAAAESTP